MPPRLQAFHRALHPPPWPDLLHRASPSEGSPPQSFCLHDQKKVWLPLLGWGLHGEAGLWEAKPSLSEVGEGGDRGWEPTGQWPAHFLSLTLEALG